MHIYSREEIEYLKEITPNRSNKKITQMFNKKFDLNQSERAIAQVRKRRGILIGLDGRFKKGRHPWNKGMKGLNIGSKETQFKKGHTPPNHRAVGSERVTGDGYIEIKIAEPNIWRGKHIIIWEKHNGPVPKGHAVIFGDGNRKNLDIDNLILVSRQQLLALNKYGLIKNDADLTRTGVVIADLRQKISERSTKRVGRQNKSKKQSRP